MYVTIKPSRIRVSPNFNGSGVVTTLWSKNGYSVFHVLGSLPRSDVLPDKICLFVNGLSEFSLIRSIWYEGKKC